MAKAVSWDAHGQTIVALSSGRAVSAEKETGTERAAVLWGVSTLVGDSVVPACKGAFRGEAEENSGADEGFDADHENDVTTVKKGFIYN